MVRLHVKVTVLTVLAVPPFGGSPGGTVGGAEGLSSAVLERADLRWSLGPLTLPHDLAMVVMWEQLYRAMTIIRGEPYHKG